MIEHSKTCVSIELGQVETASFLPGVFGFRRRCAGDAECEHKS